MVAGRMNAMKKAFRFAILSAACATVALLAFSQPKDDPLDSLKVCAATQKLIFENQFVRIIDDQIPVGVQEPLHHHPHGVLRHAPGFDAQRRPAGCRRRAIRQCLHDGSGLLGQSFGVQYGHVPDDHRGS